MGNIHLIVIDGLGVGAQEDADDYGDEGSNTLGHICAVTGCKLPNFQRLGLGNIIPLDSVPPVPEPWAAFGKMREVSAGKDSTTGHWEISGVKLDRPFPTYSNGFPEDVIDAFCKGIAVDGVLANRPYSGTAVIADYGEEHLRTGKPIVYTSADSVFQVACHVDVTPVEKLYEWCRFARENVMTGKHSVGRVIARPFQGNPGDFQRISEQRHDFSLNAPVPNLPQTLLDSGLKTYSIGKVIDLFAEKGFTQYRRTKSNDEGLAQILNIMSAFRNQSGNFVFTNLIDTDQLFGHRNDPGGYASALQVIDRAVPAMLERLNEGDVLIFTGDHGNDPTTKSTDHAREFTPLLVYPAKACSSTDLGTRSTFRDIAVSVTDYFGIGKVFEGKSFLNRK
ncbi:MAG TPA: phosphopentomutase [Balneolales bacterium]|nr:phosphopentomutase [Balneolales bacterium]